MDRQGCPARESLTLARLAHVSHPVVSTLARRWKMPVMATGGGAWCLTFSATHPLAAMWEAWAGWPALRELVAERPLPAPSCSTKPMTAT